jgi:hypothetical protein
VIAALDVLHYLTLAQQRDLILRIGAHLPEEGRLILRVMDRAETGIARVTRLCERVAVWIGWNKALRASWRPLEEIHQDMEAAGLSVLSPIGSQGLGIGNHLLVGVKR